MERPFSNHALDRIVTHRLLSLSHTVKIRRDDICEDVRSQLCTAAHHRSQACVHTCVHRPVMELSCKQTGAKQLQGLRQGAGRTPCCRMGG
ncbi:Fibulin-7 [Manis pentadactyla]|nr:Fibulin-7 [Manis pentadactyla]